MIDDRHIGCSNDDCFIVKLHSDYSVVILPSNHTQNMILSAMPEFKTTCVTLENCSLYASCTVDVALYTFSILCL